MLFPTPFGPTTASVSRSKRRRDVGVNADPYDQRRITANWNRVKRPAMTSEAEEDGAGPSRVEIAHARLLNRW